MACAQSVAACGTGFYFLPPPPSSSTPLSPPPSFSRRSVWVTRRMMRTRMKRRWRGFTSSHRPSSPSITSCPLPLPGILLSRDPPPPFSLPALLRSLGWLSDAPAAGSHTRCPHAGRDVTRTPPHSVTSGLLSEPLSRSVCARMAYAAVSRVQALYAWGITRSFSDDNDHNNDHDDALPCADLWLNRVTRVVISG